MARPMRDLQPDRPDAMRMSMPTPTAHPFREERGVTLVELLIFSVILLGVLAAASTLIITTVRLQPKITERNQQVSEARVLQERLSRELRQGSTVDSATDAQLTFRTFTRHQCGTTTPLADGASANLCRVTYTCTAGACTRSETDPTGTVTPLTEQLVSGISNTAVFGYLPSATDPNYVTTTFVFPAEDGEDAVTLSDGAGLRNR
jgi:Tfp pilus assembly protein PilE